MRIGALLQFLSIATSEAFMGDTRLDAVCSFCPHERDLLPLQKIVDIHDVTPSGTENAKRPVYKVLERLGGASS